MSVSNPSLFIRVLKVVLSRFGRVTVSGVENLYGPEGKIVVCNHVGWADPLWIGYSALPFTLHQMARRNSSTIQSSVGLSGTEWVSHRSWPPFHCGHQAGYLARTTGNASSYFPRERAPAIKSKQSAALRLSPCMPRRQLFRALRRAGTYPAHSFISPSGDSRHIRGSHLNSPDASADKEAALTLTAKLENAMSARPSRWRETGDLLIAGTAIAGQTLAQRPATASFAV